jgi:hypothetical protein
MSNLATIVNNILADSGIDDINVVVTTGSYANPAWITSLAWTKITGAPANIVTGTGTLNYHAKWVSGSALGNSLIFDDGTNVGINTTSLSKNINLAGTTRHERIYAYPNYVFDFTNSVGETFTWFRLGNATPFSQTRIFYRAGTSTSEEEGEIKVSNTCSEPFIEWTRNTYNYHIREVRARMQGGCGSCEIWVLVRHGNYNAGANTNFQWQINGGTDSSFAVVNATGTPGTGTNQKSINSTDGYFYNNSDNIAILGSMSIGTASPAIASKLFIEGNSIVLNTEGSNQAKSIYFRYSDGGDLRSDSYLTFSTGGTPSVKATLTAAGRFGIGTTAPLANLHVLGESAGSRGIIAEFRNSDNSARIDIRDENGATSQPPGLYSPVAGFGLGLYAAAGPLILYAGGILSANERLRILTTGEVGINTITPSYTLDVNGTGRFSGKLLLGGSGSAYSPLHTKSIGGGDDSGLTIENTGSGGAKFYVWPTATINGEGANKLIFSSATTANILTLNGATGVATLSNLAGSGTRMVVADANGALSTQAIGSGAITGSGTTNYLPKFTGASTIGNSIINESGNAINVAGNVSVRGDWNTTYPVYQMIDTRVGGGEWNIENGRILGNLSFYRGGTLMTLDASGNLGLGVTPSAWSGYTVLQFGGGSVSSYTDANFFEVNQNAFWNGSYKYVNNGFASRYQQTSGRHEWYQAPSGTAGNAISFTQAMTLNASGNLSIGNTNDTFKLDVTGTGRFSGNVTVNNTITAAQSTAETAAIVATSGWSGTVNNPIITFGRTALAVAGAIGYDDPNTGLYIGTTTNHRLAIRTNNSDRLTISNSGVVTLSNLAGTGSRIVVADASGTLSATSALSGYVTGSGTTNYVPKWTSGSAIGNSQIFDNGSNVGIFTTPQTWTGLRQSVQIGNSIALSAGTNYYPYASFLGNNVYYDASDVARYINSSGASIFYFNAHSGGNFSWSVADPGTAGAAITFRTPMSLNNSGQLSIVGTSSTANNLTVVGNIRAGGSGTAGGEIIASGGLGNGNFVALRHDDNNGYITVTRTVFDGHLILQPFGNVGIKTTSPAYTLDVNGSVRIGQNLSANGFLRLENWSASTSNNLFEIKNSNSTEGNSLGILFYGIDNNGNDRPGNGAFIRTEFVNRAAFSYETNLLFGTSGTEKARLTSAGNFGINTTSPNRNLTVSGTTRHERVYGYGDNALSITNSVSFGTVWVHLGTCNPFTTDKIYYRVATNTSEEEGEVTISNTCSLPFVQWQRNTYNAMVVQVRARMTGGCGQCQVWMQIRYGSDFGGAATNFRWQAYNGTDSGFTIVNATGTPGTGTNEKSIVGSEGYFYANSGSLTVADNIGIGLTAPTAKLHIDSALGNDAIRISDAAGSVRMAIGQEASYTGNYINSRNIDFKIQTYLSGGSGGNIILQTQDNGTATVTERMRVNTAGRVLMGTTSVVDSAQLTVRKTDGGNGGIVYTLAWFQNATGYENGLAIKSRDNAVTIAADFAGYAGGATDLVFATNGTTSAMSATEKMRLTTAGELWVGYTADQGAYRLQVNGSTFSSTGFFETSDIRLKTILNRHQSIDFDAIEYKWNDGKDSKLHWGYAAQEVMKLLPDAVSGSEETHYTLDYNQAHTYKIAMLEKRIAELEQQLKNK